MNSNSGHTHKLPPGYSMASQHNHGVVSTDASASQTFNLDITSVSYNKTTGKVSLSNGMIHQEVDSPYSLADTFGDMIGSLIQEGGDIDLFKAMIGEKLKEVIDEFQVGGNK